MRSFFGWRSFVCGALAVGVTISACQCYPDPQQVIQPPPAVKAVPRKVSGLFVDAKDKKLITTALGVSVRDGSGQLSTVSRDGNGAAKNQFTVNNGVLDFVIDGDAALPQDLTIVALGKGYNASSAKLTVTDETGGSFIAKMVAIADPPTGVTAVQQSAGTADSSGKTAADTTVTTPPEANTGGTTEIQIPADTTVTSADGQPLQGELTATVSYYNNSDPTSLSAFPGGLDVTVPSTTGGGTSDGAFISGGFTAITIADSAGNVAANFSQPISISVDVPAATANPENGNNPVQVGDTVPLWSYNETTGQWKSEGSVTLAAGTSPGTFKGAGTVNHLSYFNLDWFLQRCNVARPIVIDGNPQNLQLTLQLNKVGGGWYKEHVLENSDPNGAPDLNNVTLLNAPSGVAVTATVWLHGQNITNNAAKQVDIADLCSGGELHIPVTTPTVQSASLSVRVAQQCDIDPTQRGPVGGVTAVVQATGDLPLEPQSTDSNGSTTFTGLTAGTTFTVDAYKLGNSTSLGHRSITLKAGDNEVQYVLPFSCAVVSGAH